MREKGERRMIDTVWRGIITRAWADVPVSRYHLWKTTPDALRSLCGKAKRTEGQALFLPEPEYIEGALCGTCASIVARTHAG